MGGIEHEYVGFAAPEYTEDSFKRVQVQESKTADPDWFASHRPISSTPFDAHAQMLAARVEGLEKELNGLQHVWGRVKALETEVARLTGPNTAKAPDPLMTPVWLLKRALNEVNPVSQLAQDIAEFLRNR